MPALVHAYEAEHKLGGCVGGHGGSFAMAMQACIYAVVEQSKL
jgi:hypothetical protein